MTQAGAPAGAAEVPTGNTYDKYGSTNPVVRRLMEGFERDLFELLDRAAPSSIVRRRLRRGRPDRALGGADLRAASRASTSTTPSCASEWERRSRPNLEFHTGLGDRLPWTDGEFEAATAIEVLEHVPDPAAVLDEMSRVASRWLLVSVPREPLWRGLNLARGTYVRDLGNTPGHLNHWSKRGFARLLGRYGEIAELRSPLPWTMALVQIRK